MKRIWCIVVTGLLFPLAEGLACVGCREPGDLTMDTESPTVKAGVAFSWSVLFMLAVVSAVVLGLTYYIWQTCRRLERERAVA